jgi:hypothetical protein
VKLAQIFSGVEESVAKGVLQGVFAKMGVQRVVFLW